MEKQTAVEYLIDSINKRIDLTSLKYWNEIDLMVQQAKEMEKAQMEKSFQDGMDKGYYIGGGTR